MSGRLFAVIPAGGQSRRMGRPKLSLHLGGRTVLESVIATFDIPAIEETLVVLGPDVGDLAVSARAAGAQVLTLAQQTADMRATLEHGLEWIERQHRPADDDGWLLAPADYPLLDAAVVHTLCAAWSREPGASIIVPTYQGRRGHPVLIAWRHVQPFRNSPAEVGLNRYLREWPHETRELAVDDPRILVDLDTPDDYDRLVRRLGGAAGGLA